MRLEIANLLQGFYWYRYSYRHQSSGKNPKSLSLCRSTLSAISTGIGVVALNPKTGDQLSILSSFPARNKEIHPLTRWIDEDFCRVDSHGMHPIDPKQHRPLHTTVQYYIHATHTPQIIERVKGKSQGQKGKETASEEL